MLVATGALAGCGGDDDGASSDTSAPAADTAADTGATTGSTATASTVGSRWCHPPFGIRFDAVRAGDAVALLSPSAHRVLRPVDPNAVTTAAGVRMATPA